LATAGAKPATSYAEVERIHCGEDGKNLKLGAKATAARELREERPLPMGFALVSPRKNGGPWWVRTFVGGNQV
jgi:hypothetical protein